MFGRPDADLPGHYRLLVIGSRLYDDGFTIKGARKKLQEKRNEQLDQIEIPFTQDERSRTMMELREELESILAELA